MLLQSFLKRQNIVFNKDKTYTVQSSITMYHF